MPEGLEKRNQRDSVIMCTETTRWHTVQTKLNLHLLDEYPNKVPQVQNVFL